MRNTKYIFKHKDTEVIEKIHEKYKNTFSNTKTQRSLRKYREIQKYIFKHGGTEVIEKIHEKYILNFDH